MGIQVVKETKKYDWYLSQRETLKRFISSEPMIAYNFYESDDFYCCEILFAPEVALISMINRKPEGVNFHIEIQSGHFEFFIDKEFKIQQ